MKVLSTCLVTFAFYPCMGQTNTQEAGTNLSHLVESVATVIQPKAPAGATNWGRPVQDIRMSITMTNNTMDRGSSINVVGVITNSSSRAIRLEIPAYFDVVLSNDVGKLYHLIPPVLSHTLHGLETIEPGQETVTPISAAVVNNIELGDYSLQVSRRFTSSDGDFKLESNLLKIAVK